MTARSVIRFCQASSGLSSAFDMSVGVLTGFLAGLTGLGDVSGDGDIMRQRGQDDEQVPQLVEAE